MARHYFFDFEATSRFYTNARILQLGFIECDDNFNITRVFDHYYLSNGPVPPSSSEIHGLTESKLKYLADGRTIQDDLMEIQGLFGHKDAVIYGYNSQTYDYLLLNRVLTENGYEPLSKDKEHHIDVYREVTPLEMPSHKLSAAFPRIVADKGISMKTINNIFVEATGSTNIAFHGALYDAFCTMAIHMLLRM